MMDRSTWPNPEGAVVVPGGGVKPGAGTAKGSLKELGVHGDVEVGVWGIWDSRSGRLSERGGGKAIVVLKNR